MGGNNFDILDFASATKDTGPEYPQVQAMRSGYDSEASNSIYQLAKYQTELPPFEPDLDHFVLHKKAKPTDLLSNSITNSTGCLVSKRLMELLQEFNLPDHKFFPASVHHYDQILKNYFWLQVVADNTSFVDFPKSTFFIYKNYSKDMGDIAVDSKSDYEVKRSELKKKDSTLSIWAKKIVMSKDFDCSLDLFRISKFNADLFISRKLADAILNHRLTGMTVKSSNLTC